MGLALVLRILFNAVKKVFVSKEVKVATLFKAAEKGNLETLRSLLKGPFSPSVNVQNHLGETLLIIAVWNQRPDVVEFLCRMNADISLCDKGNRTAYEYASRYRGDEEITQILERYAKPGDLDPSHIFYKKSSK